MLDSALVGLKANDLEGRVLGLSLQVPELMQAIGVDELVLLTHRGEVLGAGHEKGLTGKRDPALARRAQALDKRGTLRMDGVRAVEAACLRRDPGNAKRWVALIAARHLDHILDEIGARHGVTLQVGPTHATEKLMVETTTLDQFGKMTLSASRSRVALVEGLERLDWTVLVLGGGTIGSALLLGWLLARGLARPIVLLSEQAREVVSGEPKPVVAGGGRELSELARSFNRAIADLAELRKRLAATERIAARREIARRVAHEIKNPLAPIRAAIETLRRLRARNDPAFDEYFDEASRTVLDEVARISNIVTEFTRFARLPAPRPRAFDLVEVVRSVVNLHKTSGVEIELSAGNSLTLHADPDQIKQVLTNLLQNSIDALEGTPGARIVVELRETQSEQVRVVVRDNGPGVDPALRARLFEPYQTTKQHGTGLGLAIVERIVVEHGGYLGYREAPGGGALFEATLPLAGPSLLSKPPDSSPSSGE
jgi:signal transduction histidine kinase